MGDPVQNSTAAFSRDGGDCFSLRDHIDNICLNQPVQVGAGVAALSGSLKLAAEIGRNAEQGSFNSPSSPRPHTHQVLTSTARSAASQISTATAKRGVLHLLDSCTDVQAQLRSMTRGERPYAYSKGVDGHVSPAGAHREGCGSSVLPKLLEKLLEHANGMALTLTLSASAHRAT